MKNISSLFLLSSLLIVLSCSKTPEPNSSPDYKGCGDFIVYKLNGDDKVISVQIDHNKVAFSTDFQTYSNAANLDFATIEMEQNCDAAAIWYVACNDVGRTPSCTSTHWKLVSGELSFKVSKVLASYQCMQSYLATVLLKNAVFQKEGTSEQINMGDINFENIHVGWCAG